MGSKKDTYYSHFSAFLLGALLTGMFFVGASSDMSKVTNNVEPDRAKALTGAVFYAGLVESNPISLMHDSKEFVFATTSNVSATSSTTTVPSATTTLQYGNEEIFVEKTVYFPPPPKIIEKIIVPVVEEEVVETVEEEEKVLPEGVYVLANGDYVDKNGDKISGDPYLYNYKPPQEEENFTTPGGVVMNRFGVILHSPEVVDESKILIPPTVVDIENPPSTISPIYIPRLVTLAISQNELLTCTQLQLYGNDHALCELYKTNKDDYTWIRVDLEEEW